MIGYRRTVNGRRTRAYTVVEIMIAATLGALVVLAGLRWAGGVSQIALGALRTGDSRSAVVALDRIGDDLASSRHCDAYGRDAVLRNMTPSSMAFIADPDADGTPDAVWWRFVDGKLQRSVTALDANCAANEPSVWSTQLTDAVIVSFRPVVDGMSSTNPDDYPVCTDVFGAGCGLEAVTIRISRDLTTESLESTFPVNTR